MSARGSTEVYGWTSRRAAALGWLGQLGFMASMFRRCLRLRPRATIGSLILLVVGVLSSTAMAFLQGFVVDGVLGQHRAQLIAAAVIGALCLTVNVTSFRFRLMLVDEVSDVAQLALTEDLLRWTTEAATVEHLDEPEYLDRLSRVLRDAGAVAFAVWATIEALASVVALGVTLTLLWRIHPPLAGLLVFSVPAVLLAGRAGTLYLDAIDRNEQRLRLETELHQIAVRPDSVKELLVSGSGAAVDRHASRVWRSMIDDELSARRLAVLLTGIGWALYTVGTGLVAAWVIQLYWAGEVSVGEVATAIALSVSMLGQVNGVLSSRNRVIESGRVTEHYLWLRRRAATLPRAGTPIARLARGLQLRDVGFRYPGSDRDVLSGVTVDIPAGSVLGVVGVNGAGKSTLVKLLTGLYRPTAGEVLADGSPIGPGELSQSTAGAFQDYLQPHTLAHEAVGLGHPERLDDLAAVGVAAERGGAQRFVQALPDQWHTQLGETFDGHRPSQGQWQRLALARGLMRTDPVVLVLDEPTAALDPQAEHDLYLTFAEHAREIAARTGAVTVLVSHRFSTVTMTDQVLVLDDGRVVEQGSHAELMTADTRYRRLYQNQAQGFAL